MPDTPSKKPVRWRETRVRTDEASGLPIREHCVHETVDPPANALVVNVEPHGWIADNLSD